MALEEEDGGGGLLLEAAGDGEADGAGTYDSVCEVGGVPRGGGEGPERSGKMQEAACCIHW